MGRAGGVGIAGTLVVLAVGYFFGIDVSPLVQGMDGGSQQTELSERDEQMGQFVSVVLADTEEVWTPVLRDQADIAYVEPTLVMFRGATWNPPAPSKQNGNRFPKADCRPGLAWLLE